METRVDDLKWQRIVPGVALLALALPAQDPNPSTPRLPLEQVLLQPRSLLSPLPTDRWIPGGRVLSRVLPDQADSVLALRAGKAAPTVLFTAKDFNNAFVAAGVRIANPAVLGAGFTWVNQETIRVQFADGIYHWRLATERAEKILPLPRNAQAIAIASRDRAAAFVKNQQLYVQVASGNPRQVTTDGTADIQYGTAAHRAEFGIQDGIWWNASGSAFAFSREDLRPITKYPYADHTTMPPRSLHGRYPMAGRSHSSVQIGVCDAATGAIHYLESDGTDQYWTNTTFTPDGKSVLVALVNRAQNHMQLVRFDAATGKRGRTLFEERDEQWVEPELPPQFLPDGSGRFLWLSSRRGFRQLYLYAAEGTNPVRVTDNTFDVAEIVHVAPDGTSVLFMGSGKNPLEMHLFAAQLDGSGTRQITRGRGWHTCAVSADGGIAHDRFSNLEQPGQSQLIDLATGTVSQITRTKDRFPIRGEQSFFTVAADDGTPLHGTLIYPPGMDRSGAKKYPVLLYVYGGPHSQLVRDTWLGGANLWLQYMATRGCIICTLDNRGTDNRGIEFAQAIHRRLADLEVADQMQAVKFLRNKPFVDAKRIGVHGWSYGGYMTLNLMTRTKAFACGASGAPVTNWESYETGYTERYMDTPAENPKGYAKSSVLDRADDVHGRLLIIHGTDDKTVMWSHSLAFVDRCIDAGTLIDYMPYPMQKHGIRGRDRVHLYRLLTRFFEDHLQISK